MLTPGQFARRAGFYQQVGQLTAAGLGLIGALEQLQRHPPSRDYREPIASLLESLGQGYTLTESLQRMGRWLPEFDIALLQAGEQSGRIDASFRLLSDYYHDRAQIARQVIADLAYPAALLHFAVFILPFPQLFLTGDWVAYGVRTLGILLPIYAFVGVMVYATQSAHGETWRSWIESLLGRVPVLGTARREMALARLSAALEALLSAGVTIVEAWDLAAAASGSPALRRTVRSWKPMLDAGRTPAELVSSSPEFPEVFSGQYATGEVSGQLDETLGRLRQYYQDVGSRKLHALAQWTPRLVYLLIVVAIAYRIVQFWMGYFQQIQNAAGFGS